MKDIVERPVSEENPTCEQRSEGLTHSKTDTGLYCLISIARFHGISVDLEQVKHTYAVGSTAVSEIELIKIAKDIGFKIKAVNLNIEALRKMTLPAIGYIPEEGYIIIAKIEGEKILVLKLSHNNPMVINQVEFEKIWDGRTLLLTPRIQKTEGTQPFGIKWFIPSIIKYKKQIAEILVSSFTLQILGLFSPIVIQVVIDKVLVHQSFSTLNVMAFGLIMVIIFETLMALAKNYIFTHTTNRIDILLGSRLFKHLFSLPLNYFESRRIGDTVARVRELENIRRFLTGSPLTSLLDVFFIIVYIAVMLFYSFSLTGIVLISLPIFAILSAIVTPLYRKRLDDKFNTGAEQQSFLVETVSGVQTIKSFALEPQVQKKWEGLLANYIKASFKTAILAGNSSAIGQMIQKVFDIAVLWLGAHLVISGKLSVGQFVAFRMLASRVSTPVLRLVQMWQEFQQTSISVKRVGDIFNTKQESELGASKTRLPSIIGSIEFDKVWFRYRIDGSDVIKDLSFKIKPGTIIGLVGRSGSGKSTISKLIQRLYIPQSGKIMIDGVDLALADPSWLRRQVGVVLQESFLFNASVRENISIHKPSANMNEIMNVAQVAGAHDFILELPEGYDTMIGEKGVGLSGGQKQRIAIARALLSNPKILIFDEATSALDYESESIIQKNLKQICKNRTVIIIAHRLSTLRSARKIMVIDKGKIVEYGSHEELMNKQGLYNYLYNQQERNNLC
ncbi:MAG: type I secretion system permease/ATPase [Oscillospiraceae bacterium]|nr:type I secretion system permease/ATPase [Oscillospiraceae bacterium]MDD4590776.1 type I secretion system permease/ATPase [Parabacteroides sp.]